MNAPDIHLTDLADPVFSDFERQAIDTAQPVEMSDDAVLSAAMAETGLSDFGPDDFRERLHVWMRSLDEDGGLNDLGRAGSFGMSVRYAANRLRLEDLLKRQPEIQDVIIDRPICIAGLPRSGTTHLVNILAHHPDLRSMQLWESMEPVPKPGEENWEISDNNPRYKRCIDTWQILTVVLKYWSAMHEMEPNHVHEEVELQCIDFSSYMIEWQGRVPRWQQHYFDRDQAPHYRYAKKVLQAMTWYQGPNRWVMKSPPNMENLIPLFDTYPDATVVITHRDPVAVIQSTVTMMAYWDRIRRNEHDMGALADQWIYRIEKLLQACVRDRDKVPDKQVIDVMFHEYMADQRSTVDHVLARAKLPITAAAEQAIENYLQEKPRGKLGRVIYDLKGHFGVDVAALRRRFQFYYDRFPVAEEPTLGE